MLTSLSIKNFALIEDVNLQLKDKFTIITGETGAGKSILLGALSLLLGKRADLNSVKNPEKKCVIEGVFSIEAYQLEQLFVENDLDFETQTIVRREILPSGKSRAFVNDSPVNLQQMAALGGQLVDIHSQHETLFIGDANYQYRVIDALAGNGALRDQFQKEHKAHTKLLRELEVLKSQQQEAQKAYDYNVFQLKELQEAKLKEGMLEDLETQYQELSNVEELKENLSASLYQLDQEDVGAISVLQEVKNKLTALENYGDKYAALSERIKSVLLEVEDISVEIDRLQDKVEDDPENLSLINDQLQRINSLQKKHATASVEDLLSLQAELEEKVATSEGAEEAIAVLNGKIKSAKAIAEKSAKRLYENRKKAIPGFISSVENLLKKVGMPDAKLKVELEYSATFNNFGGDEMHWKLAANKGGSFNELRKVASGGELSRITLAVKSILASYSKLPTIIFDEIDTGVSGDIAQKMGDIMSEMGEKMQVVSISHLPQIAAKGNQHFKVYKETEDNSTKTNIKMLNQEERVQELAEMLGGKENSASAIAHAKALLN